ncbi:hypothetical protein CLAUDI_22 [Bacillus phage Claudi]|uniref:Uncharacterized protein n=1 Tax=Bacillus phage Claudi TaxID=1874001 RepID=A0A1B1PAI2_9CAUD|nr:hypothetical protein MUK67_gp22 [Bacillus phage Claudi]ANT41176.1 hypothetical protein CLAUDI_22 [Bacillus phage Claudi]
MNLSDFINKLDSIVRGSKLEEFEVVVEYEGGCCRTDLLEIKIEDNKIIIDAI